MTYLSRILGRWTKSTQSRRPRKSRGTRRQAKLEVMELESRLVPTLLGKQLFPTDYPWNQNISNAPVANNSATIISHIGTSVKIHPDWGNDSPSNGSSPLYGIPFNVVHGNTAAKINVIIDNYPGESDIFAVPMPANVVIEGDYQNGPNPWGAGYNGPGSPGFGTPNPPQQRGDSHLIVWDVDNNITYELYGVTRPSDPVLFPNANTGVEAPHTDGLWHAAQETVWDMKTNVFRSLGYTSADAAGLSILAGLVRPDEGLPIAVGGQGVINHAIRFTLPSADVNPQYIYPASHQVSTTQRSNSLPFGARLRLMNTPAVNALINSMGPQAQIIAHAMQQYGLVLADIGSAMYITGTSASQDANNVINFTWNMNDVLGLSALTAGNFEVVSMTPVVTGLNVSSGSAGNTITITGQNFSGAAGHLSVFFGSTAASSVTFANDTTITAVVPNGSGTVHVTVRSGVNLIDSYSSNPNANVTSPIFGYGTSQTSAADQFTFTTSSPATHFSISAPAGATAGTAFNVTVTALDAANQTATGYSGTVHFTSSDGLAVLPANSTLTNGVRTFSFTLKTAGNQTLMATDTVTPTITGTSSVIGVSAAAATHFSVNAPASATAGTAINFTFTAQDAFNNTATSYSGTVHFTGNDGAAVLPANSTLSNGVGTFPATLKTAGNRTLTATDSISSAITGASGNVIVSPAAPHHLAFGVQPGGVAPGSPITLAPTVRILDQYNNLVTGNNTAQVTLGIASGPDAFTGTSTTTVTVSGGIATFSNLVLLTTGTYTLTESATGGLSGPVSNSFQVQILQVASFSPTSIGFIAQFNRPFNPASLNIYDSQAAGLGLPDVTVVGTTTGAIRGSLVIDPTNSVVTFIRTGAPLPADVFTVTLRSAANGFASLDGNGDGTAGDDFVTTFTVAASTAVTISVPDFARGPGQVVNVPATGNNGIALTLSNGAGVTTVQLALQYDPTFLTITGALVNSGLTGATFTLDPSSTAGNAVLIFNSPTALNTGAVSLGQLVAQVPNTAPYKSKQVLHLANLQVNGGSIAAVNDDGIHVVAYLGDASGDGIFTAADSALTSRVAVGLDAGFGAYRMVDPAVLSDINRNGRVDSGDASILLQLAAGNPTAFVPPIPFSAPPILPTGPDPQLSIPTALSASAGEIVTVPVSIDDPMPAGSTGLTQAVLALTYDPSVFSVSSADIHLGSVPLSGSGWVISSLINPITGQIAIILYSTTPIQSSNSGSLVTIDFHVRADVTPGVTPISLVPEVNPTGAQIFRTVLEDAQGLLILHYANSTSLNDLGSDSLITIGN